MPCIPVQIPGAFGLVCTRGGRRPKPCSICGQPSARLCDWRKPNGKSCSKPLCERCAVPGGPDVDWCPSHRGTAAPELPARAPDPLAPVDLLVLGCVATKRQIPAPAAELYTSQLWRARRHYAEPSGLTWCIFSALHGLVRPDKVLAPYNVSFSDRDRRGEWRVALSARAADQISSRGFRAVELHAGVDYLVDLVPLLVQRGIDARRPLQGLGIGEQLAWYTAQARQHASVPVAQLPLFIDDSTLSGDDRP